MHGNAADRKPARPVADRCLPDLFAEQAGRSPQATALVSDSGSLTYAELDAWAGRLAGALTARGVGPDVRAGVCAERGPDLVVALLAVLKAGGAFVPLDPEYPAERLAFMLADSGASVVVCQEHLRARLSGLPPEKLVDVGEEGPAGSRGARTVPANLAYVMYTSGSTGRPKGVCIPHAGIVNRLDWMQSEYRLTADDRVLQKTPSSFDVSMWEFFWPLLTGAALVLARPGGHREPDYLAEVIRRERITTVHFVPSMLEAFLDASRTPRHTELRRVFCSGEALPGELVDRWFELFGDVPLHNLYGPTETSVDVTYWECRRGAGRVPIGRPVSNTRVYVLDDVLRPVPAGATGELYVGGVQLARGYHDRPALTAERFVADPFEPGTRMYRTGDLGRQSETGDLEYAGRTDDQVKIRGFRVEPGEVESVLARHPAVRRAAVLATGDDPADRRLVAYLVGARERPSLSALRAFAAARLPEYMVPTAFVFVREFPVTPSGKLDRRALPEPGRQDRTETGRVAPRDGVEGAVAEVWAEVLGTADIGVHDDFFHLGGDSLSALRVLSRIEAALGATLPARALFDTPTVAGLAVTVTRAGQERPEPLPVALRTADVPASFAQGRFWFFQQFDPGSVEYNVHSGYRLTGALDVDALRTAWAALLARHEVLRTALAHRRDALVQVIADPADAVPDVSVVDLSALPDEQRPAELEHVLRAEVGKPFDLGTGKVGRLLLVRERPDRHVLVIGLHHSVTDGWSNGVVAAELSALYAAENRPGAVAEPAVPQVQYAEFAVWQRVRLSGPVARRQLTYWREQLAGVVPLDLPTDRPRPPVKTSAGAAHNWTIDAETAGGLRKLGADHDATLFMTLVAACQVLLARHSGQRDIALGTVVSGRDRPEWEQVLGCFINTVVLRSQVDEDLSPGEFLGRVRETVLGAFGNQDVPFDRVVDELCEERDPARTPLFQAMVVLQNAPEGELALPGAEAEPIVLPYVAALFDLHLEFRERDGELDVLVQYNTDLFDAATIERLAGHLTALLSDMAAFPRRPMRRSALLTGPEERAIAAWSGVADPGSGPGPVVHERFAEWVRRRPDAVAVTAGSREVGYAELDARANRLAHRLAGLGVGGECGVAVLLSRSVDLLVSVLAILKAGGFYVPLDAGHPVSRSQFTVDESRVSVLLTDRASAGVALPEVGTVVVVDDDPAPAGLPSTDPGVVVHPDQLAYVLYTSGSTGRPKGVAVTHRDILDFVQDSCWRDDAQRRVLVHSALVFDLSTYEMWVPLLRGGTAVLAPPGDEDTATLARTIVEHRVTSFWATAPLFHVLAEDNLDALAGVHEVWAGGDVVLAGPVRRVLESCPGVVVCDGYGPTEATTFATFHRMKSGLGLGDRVPIGRPLDGMGVRVLDGRLRCVPVGVAGELYISGAGLARGYFARPGLSAERFVADPFGVGGGRMYRSGDVVRWTSGGVLEFVGRVDDQVKVRGNRVELGEVEAVLRGCRGVADAVVVARLGVGGKRLVGYVVPSGGDFGSVSELRDELGSRLPAYMVPAIFVVLENLPLNTSGKVDRNALPKPELVDQDSYSPPAGRVQEQLAAIWSAVLGVERIGTEQNFFALGGDSIIAIQAVSKAHRAGLRMTSKDLFRWPTIAALSPHVTSAPESAASRVRDDDRTAVPLTPVQHLLFERTSNPAVFNQYLVAELRHAVDEPALRTAVANLFEHHDVLRTRFVRDGDAWRADAGAATSTGAFEAVDLTAAPESEADGALRRAIETRLATVDAANGPLLRVLLLATAKGARLALIAHHLVVDGMSWRILLEDLETGYRQALGRLPLELGAPTSRFRDWARRLKAHADAGGFDDEIGFWAQTGRPGDETVPGTGTGPNTVRSAREVRVRLAERTTAALLREVPEVYRTEINDVLLAALAPVLAGWAGRQRITVGLEGHGREELFDDVDITRTTGWFTSYCPVVLEVEPGAGWGERLKSVKERLRAVPRNGVGYGVLRYLRKAPAVAAYPHPEVGFNYLGRFDAAVAESEIYRSVTGIGLHQEPDDTRLHVLEIVGLLRDGQLEFTWSYSANRHTRPVVTRLAEEFLANLEGIVRHCAEETAGGRTPADFPLARLDQAAVDRLVGNGRGVEDVYPLTSMQSGILFDSLLSADPGTYLVQFDLLLAGVSDVHALAAAWQRVVDRTPILRTSVAGSSVDDPLQVVRRGVRLPVRHHDWRQLSARDRDERLRTLLAEDRAAGFELGTAPLARLALIRITDTQVRTIWTVHHIVVDGWSAFQIFGELFGRRRDRRPFRDYVEWSLRQDRTGAEDYWRTALAGFGEPTPLPYDRTPGPGTSPRGAERSDLPLPPGLGERLASYARQHTLTMNTLVQGAWAAVLACYGGTADVCFGATVSGRPAELPGAESILGICINTLPVRVLVEADRPVVSWLREMQAEQAQAREFDGVSLSQVRSWSELPQGRPLFDSIVVFENYPADKSAFLHDGTRLVSVDSSEISPYPLTLVCRSDERLSLLLMYDPDLIGAETVRRLGDTLVTVLAAIASRPERTVGALPLVGEAEREQLLAESSAAVGSGPGPVVHERFAEWVRRRPDAVAVTAGSREVGYAELDARANRLAHRLAGLGVGGECGVAVLLSRSVDLLVSVLAILKAGGFCVPLDSRNPPARRQLVVDESRASVLLTDRASAGVALPEVGTVVVVDDDPAPAGLPSTDPGVVVHPDQLAYVMYTSGSTGTPKGVGLTHRDITDFVADSCWDNDFRRKVLMHAPYAFDAFNYEMWVPLLRGDEVVLAPPGDLDIRTLAGTIVDNDVNSAGLTTALLHAMSEESAEALANLREIWTGGEQLAAGPVRRVLDSCPGVVLNNGYGPTEVTTFATFHRMKSGLGLGDRVPIGRPLDGMGVRVLDGRLRCVPVGVAGELYISGAGLARGYFARPGLSAERFVADPFGVGGGRMYRSGDVVRWTSGGVLEFVGRVDDQVKVRGNRVELGEVEAVLRGCRGVADAVVVARPGVGGKRLVGYVVPSGGDFGSVSELRDELGSRLPAYMVPADFALLDHFPLTIHAKVDRNALPEPEDQDDTAGGRVAPRDSTERALADLWCDLLALPAVGVTDDFFALGGDSILSLRLLSRIRRTFGVDLPLRELFDAPTIAELAPLLQGRVLAELERIAGAGGPAGEGSTP